MTENLRGGYGFTQKDKQMVHQRAGKACEFPGFDCPEPNTGQVNHITGVAEGRMSGMPKSVVSDPELNAVMLCDSHELQHDLQENFQVNMLRAEGHPLGVQNARHHRRRHRRHR